MKTFSLVFLACAVAVTPSAWAATYTVDNLNDSGTGSLRAAITSANTAAGAPHTINFASNVQGTLNLASEIIISNSMTINGSGAQRLKIDGGNAHRLFRINLPNSTQAVTLTGMELTRGAALGSEAGYGGAIYKARGSLQIIASNLSANSASYRGGAIYSDAGAVSIDSVTMNDNVVSGPNQPSGGALYMRSGTFTSRYSAILNNRAEFGGGLALVSPGNHAVIENTLIEGNIASGAGGGIRSVTFDSFRMSNSALINNSARTEGGGFFFDGATTASSVPGIIENTTFYGNRSTAVTSTSSALSAYQGGLEIRNCSFVNNVVSPEDVSENANAGAIWVGGSNAQVKIISSLFDQNTRNGFGFSDLARVAATSQPSTLEVGNSLFRSAYNSSVITSQLAPNQFATNAQLLPLDRSVGLTPVVPLSRLSPAIDRGDNPGNLTTDQRGGVFARAWSDPNQRNTGAAKVDIGAYEFRGDAFFVGDFEQR